MIPISRTVSLRRYPRASSEAPRIVRLLRPILGIQLELKLLGANLIILGVAVLVLFGPIHLNPGRLTDILVLVTALSVGAVANFVLVRLALRPITTLERVARRVSEGRLGERVPDSIVADRDLAQLSKTMNDMLDKLAAGRERMRKLGAEVVYAEEKERSRVARDLHDSVGQTLAAASFQAAAAAYEIGDHEASPRIAEVRQLLRTAIEEIRNVSRSLHPRVAIDLGLPDALEALADATRQRSLVDVKTKIDVSGVVIPAPVSSTMYRIAQEALRNVETHVDVVSATLTLFALPGYIELEVTDDGRGIEGPLEKKRSDAQFAKMRERLSLAGGDLHIDSTDHSGTRIRAWVGMETEAA